MKIVNISLFKIVKGDNNIIFKHTFRSSNKYGKINNGQFFHKMIKEKTFCLQKYFLRIKESELKIITFV